MKNLFDRTSVKSLELKNRFIRSAVWMKDADDKGYLTDNLRKTYEDLAKGGTGLILTGYAFISEDEQPNPKMLGIYDDSFIEKYRELVDKVHSRGSKIAMQIAMGGSQSHHPDAQKMNIFGPSAVENRVTKVTPKEATKEDLESVVYLHNRSWMTSSTPFTPIAVDTIQKLFEYPETTILIAKVYGNDSGFAILDLEGNNNEFGVIAGLGVLPRFQRKGLGTVIGMAAWNYFKKIGVKELRCEVYKSNKVSYNFIKSLGFEEFCVKTYKRDDFRTEDT